MSTYIELSTSIVKMKSWDYGDVGPNTLGVVINDRIERKRNRIFTVRFFEVSEPVEVHFKDVYLFKSKN
jgi:hypothetical protein